MQIPLGPKHLYCPMWKKSMDKVCHTCPWWVQVRGTNPNTGAEVDKWECSIGILPLLMIQNAKEVRQGAAATEAFRNEMARTGAMAVLPGLIAAITNGQITEPTRLIEAEEQG